MEQSVQKDFFISYSSADLPWAKWINYQLEEMGFSTEFAQRDFHPGGVFPIYMHNAIEKAEHIIAVLSPNYLEAEYTQPEWAAAFAKDPAGKKGILVPVRVRECDLKGLLIQIIYIDLVGLDEEAARKELLDRLPGTRQMASSKNLDEGPGTIVKRPPFPGKIAPVWSVPYRQNDQFRGREVILKRLYDTFHADKATSLARPRLLALTGLGGIGKTQTAIEYAYRHRDKYQIVLWVRADSHETLSSGFVDVAEKLNLPEKDVKERQLVIAAVKDWLAEHCEWLLILDNVSELRMVRDFIPDKGKGHVLLTTQTHAMGGIAQRIQLEQMEIEEAVLFLLRRVNIISPAADTLVNVDDYARAKDIVQALGGLPLALEQAGAYIEDTGCSLSRFLDLCKKQKPDFLKRQSKYGFEHATVFTTWSLSFSKIEQANPMASDLLRLCSFLHPDAIPVEMIESIAPASLGFDDVIAELLNFSLICRNQDETLTVHSLVQDVLKGEMNEDVQRLWAERAVCVVSQAFPDSIEPDTWPLCQRCLPHAQVCVDLIKKWNMESIEAARLLHRTGWYLLERAQYAQAKLLLKESQTKYEKSGGKDAELAMILDNLGRLHVEQCEYTEAEQLYKKALTIRKRVLGSDHPDVAQSLNHLALLYYNQGKYNKAEPLYTRALTIEEQKLGKYHMDVAITLNNLAWLYCNLGQYDQAESLLTRALKIQQRPEGSESPAMATTLNALALVVRAKGEYPRAEKLFQQALKIRKRELGQKHPDVATTLNDMAWLFRTQGRYDEAKELYRQVMEIRMQTLGPSHLHVATTLNDIAVLSVDLGEYTQLTIDLSDYTQDESCYRQVEPCYQKVLEIRRQLLGQEHPRVAITLYNIGWLYYHKGQYAEAELHHRQALDIRKKILHDGHLLYMAQSCNALAEVYHAQGNYAQAERYYRDALEIRQQILGKMHRNVITVINNLASLYVDQGKYAEAENLYGELLALGEQVIEPKLPRIAMVLNNVASFYVEQGKYAQAEPLYQKALTLHEKILGPEHPDAATIGNNLATLRTYQGSYEDAESRYQTVIDIRLRKLRPEHPHLAQSYHDLATLFRIQGDRCDDRYKKYEFYYKEAELLYQNALRIRKKSLRSEEHPHVLQSCHSLALLYVAMGKYGLAETHYKKALAIREKVLGAKHLHVVQICNDLARLYCIQGRYLEAEPLYQRALGIDEQQLGGMYIHIATVLENYAALLKETEWEAEAAQLEARAQVIRIKLAH